jgi:hypothetical protein
MATTPYWHEFLGRRYPQWIWRLKRTPPPSDGQFRGRTFQGFVSHVHDLAIEWADGAKTIEYLPFITKDKVDLSLFSSGGIEAYRTIVIKIPKGTPGENLPTTVESFRLVPSLTINHHDHFAVYFDLAGNERGVVPAKQLSPANFERMRFSLAHEMGVRNPDPDLWARLPENESEILLWTNRKYTIVQLGPANAVKQMVLDIAIAGVIPGNLGPRMPNRTYSHRDGETGLFDHAKRHYPSLKFESDKMLSQTIKNFGYAKSYHVHDHWGYTFVPLKELRSMLEDEYGPREWTGGLSAEWKAV